MLDPGGWGRWYTPMLLRHLARWIQATTGWIYRSKSLVVALGATAVHPSGQRGSVSGRPGQRFTDLEARWHDGAPLLTHGVDYCAWVSTMPDVLLWAGGGGAVCVIFLPEGV